MCGEAQAEGPSANPTEVLQQFVRAVRAGDADGVLRVLSSRVIDHYDLTEEKIEADFSSLRSQWGPVGRSLEPAFERRLSNELAVAALKERAKRVRPGPRALAEALVREDGSWKVEPFLLRISQGYPDDLSADPRRPFLTFFVTTTGSPEARLWIDGRELPVRNQPGLHVAFEARPRKRLAKGRHVVLVFAKVGDRVGARAWLIRI